MFNTMNNPNTDFQKFQTYNHLYFLREHSKNGESRKDLETIQTFQMQNTTSNITSIIITNEELFDTYNSMTPEEQLKVLQEENNHLIPISNVQQAIPYFFRVNGNDNRSYILYSAESMQKNQADPGMIEGMIFSSQPLPKEVGFAKKDTIFQDCDCTILYFKDFKPY